MTEATETTPNTELYDGLFLFSLSQIEGDVNAALDHLRQILDRAEAEVITLSKWEERKLAYEIKGERRGLYLLTHFKARGSQIANIERDVNLSELLLRCLIIKADHIGETEMDAFKERAAKSADEVKLKADADADADAEAATAESTDTETDTDARPETRAPAEPASAVVAASTDTEPAADTEEADDDK